MGKLPSGAGAGLGSWWGDLRAVGDLDGVLLGGWGPVSSLLSALPCPRAFVPAVPPAWLILPQAPPFQSQLQGLPLQEDFLTAGLGHLLSLAVTAPTQALTVSEIILFIPHSLVPAVSSFQQR